MLYWIERALLEAKIYYARQKLKRVSIKPIKDALYDGDAHLFRMVLDHKYGRRKSGQGSD